MILISNDFWHKKERLIQCIVGYCYKYSCAAYDCFCAAGSHIFSALFNILSFFIIEVNEQVELTALVIM